MVKEILDKFTEYFLRLLVQLKLLCSLNRPQHQNLLDHDEYHFFIRIYGKSPQTNKDEFNSCLDLLIYYDNFITNLSDMLYLKTR